MKRPPGGCGKPVVKPGPPSRKTEPNVVSSASSGNSPQTSEQRTNSLRRHEFTTSSPVSEPRARPRPQAPRFLVTRSRPPMPMEGSEHSDGAGNRAAHGRPRSRRPGTSCTAPARSSRPSRCTCATTGSRSRGSWRTSPARAGGGAREQRIQQLELREALDREEAAEAAEEKEEVHDLQADPGAVRHRPLGIRLEEVIWRASAAFPP